MGQLLNDVGLFYSDFKQHKKALSCFEQVQKIFHWNSKDRKLEAIILKNIGVTYNCLDEYELCIDYNRQASEIYGWYNAQNFTVVCICHFTRITGFYCDAIKCQLV